MKVRTHHNRYPSGAITPKTRWRLYAGNPLAPLRRKQIGSYTPEIDKRQRLHFPLGIGGELGSKWHVIVIVRTMFLWGDFAYENGVF